MTATQAQASVVVRTFNSARTLTSCLESLRAQTVVPEIVVVDSGSTDVTLAIAERLADRIVRIPHESFSYGGALNRGAAVATAPIQFAFSSTAFCRDAIGSSARCATTSAPTLRAPTDS